MLKPEKLMHRPRVRYDLAREVSYIAYEKKLARARRDFEREPAAATFDRAGEIYREQEAIWEVKRKISLLVFERERAMGLKPFRILMNKYGKHFDAAMGRFLQKKRAIRAEYDLELARHKRVLRFSPRKSTDPDVSFIWRDDNAKSV